MVRKMGRLKHVVVAAYGRSAVAKGGKKGALRGIHPVDLGGEVLQGVLKKIPELNPDQIDDVIVGCAQQEGKQSNNIGRLVARRAGLPDSVPGMSVNRFCSSGLQAIALAAGQIESGLADVIVAGGVESMSSVPISYERYKESVNPWIWQNAPEHYMSMGMTAENVAERYGITREEMDDFAVRSHLKAAKAQAAGRLSASVIPVSGVDENGNSMVFQHDQGIRPEATMVSMSALKPCFKEDGIVTAGTSSPTSDGAGFVVLMSEEKAEELGICPEAKFTDFAVAGCSPAYMGLGPIEAVRKLVKTSDLSVQNIDVIELNEAFASQAIACIRELSLNPEKVNPNGGAIALGHPLGATGAILTCKVLDELKRTGGKTGMVTMCIGGGMGAAGIYELV